MNQRIALGLAIGLDAVFGDPPNAVHPVAWLGRCAHALDRRAPRAVSAGAVAAALVAGVSGLVAALLQSWWPRRLGGSTLTAGVLLSVLTARRTLLQRAREVAQALEADDLPDARRLLAHHLVSRETSELDASQVAAAAIESVAENLSDAVVAPWWWFVMGGVPAAAVYRALNTLDGMWGYRTPEYDRFGRVAARADDVANLVPARLTALCICAGASFAGGDALGAASTWKRDRRQTESPNAGHPMAAMAGALGVTLEKPGMYRLGEGGREPEAGDIERAVRLAEAAAWVAAGLLLLCPRRNVGPRHD